MGIALPFVLRTTQNTEISCGHNVEFVYVTPDRALKLNKCVYPVLHPFPALSLTPPLQNTSVRVSYIYIFLKIVLTSS
jgi:hypothetical protein